MILSTQPQDPINLFSHFFRLFHFLLLLGLRNAEVFEKSVYEVTQTFKCHRGCTWSSTEVAKVIIIFFLQDNDFAWTTFLFELAFKNYFVYSHKT